MQATPTRISYRLYAALILAACSPGADDARSPATSAPIEVVDDAGLTVRLDAPARRIVSLVPSATEVLVAIGAADAVVGRTRYDVAPEVSHVPSVGGGLDPSIESLIALRPDLVIAWESDGRETLRARLTAVGVPVFALRTQDTTDILRGIATLGRITGRDSAATTIASAVRDTLDAIRREVAGRERPSALYVVHHDPPMTAGPGTFIGQLIALAGARPVFGDIDQLWPAISMEAIVQRDPDILIVPVSDSTTGALARFRQMAGWRELRAVRNGRVVEVPGDLMSRPGPGIAQAARVLARALR